MRLGDTIDDRCSRCKRTMDHDIVAMVGEEVKKVRCRTCNSEHKYRGNRYGRKEMTAAEAFNRVLASVTAAQGHSQADSKKKK
jgi:NMD protein affecting ribosome stability and mRNA decay